MRRRDFLMINLGTGLLLGPQRLLAAPLGLQTGDGFRREPLDSDWAVAYWLGSDRLTEPTAPFRAVEEAEALPLEVALAGADEVPPFRPDLVDAAEVPVDESLEGKQVRLTFIGLQPDETVWLEAEIPSFYLHAYSAPRETNPDLPAFLLWSYDPDEGPKHGSPARCKVQIEQGRDLLLETAPEAFVGARQSLVFSMNGESSLPKARLGVYVVARRDPTTGHFPDWSDYQFRSSDPQNLAARKYLYRLDGDRLVMAAFPYFLLTLQP